MFVRVYRIIKLIAEGMLVRSFVMRVEGIGIDFQSWRTDGERNNEEGRASDVRSDHESEES